MRSGRQPIKRPMVMVMAVSGGIVLTWFVLRVVLAVDRGLDITDEGLYLLSADPPTATATWQFPFGWHTRPLLSWVGHDLADFRNLGAVILLVLSAWLGWVSVRVLAARSSRSQAEINSSAMVGAMVGGIGSLLYYGGFLRTPSYNWINLVGITMAGAAQTAYVGLLGQGRQSRGTKALLVAVCSFGLFYSFPGKPSTPVLMAVVGFILVALVSNLRRAFFWTGALTVTTIGWILVAALVGWWPAGFADVFVGLLDRPTLTDTQAVGGAISSLLSVPLRPWQLLTSPNRSQSLIVGVVLGLISLAIGVFGTLGTQAPRWMRPAAFAGLVASSLVIVSAPPMQDSPGVGRWAHAPAALAGVFVVCAGLIAVGRRTSYRRTSDIRPALRDRLGDWGVPAYLISLPFIFGFGSSWSPFDQAANAAGIFLIAAVTMLSLRRAPDIPRAAFVIGAVTLAIVAVTISDSRQFPYRNPPISDHNVPVTVGGHTVYLDPDLANVLTELDQRARDGGWTEGTPIVGLQWRWSTTVPYFLGGRPPESLMLTIFGYVGTVERAEYSLQNRGEFALNDAWVISTTPDALSPLGVEQTAMVTDVLAQKSGRPFPDDYICVAEVASFQLWKPSTENERPNPQCSRANITSNYNASFGWEP